MTSLPIFDGHNDTLLRLHLSGEKQSFFERSQEGHLDLPRAREGGFGGGFFAIHLPPDPGSASPTNPPVPIPAGPVNQNLPPALELTYAQRLVMAMSARLFRIEAESAGQVKVIRTATELAKCLRAGVVAAILHFEGAEAIDPDMDALEVFYRAGLRSLGIVWSRPNRFAEGVPFRWHCSADTGPGLTEDGRRLVRACNRLGILVDLSHLNERGFWDVAELSRAPLVATHSNVHALCASTRNLNDRQLDAIRETGGVVGLNFAVNFLREDGKRDADTPLEVMVRHLDYLVDRLGVDGAAFGSDFDGCLLPAAIGDVTGLPRLLDFLRDRGYDEPALRKITHENWVRVLKATWKPLE